MSTSKPWASTTASSAIRRRRGGAPTTVCPRKERWTCKVRCGGSNSPIRVFVAHSRTASREHWSCSTLNAATLRPKGLEILHCVQNDKTLSVRNGKPRSFHPSHFTLLPHSSPAVFSKKTGANICSIGAWWSVNITTSPSLSGVSLVTTTRIP